MVTGPLLPHSWGVVKLADTMPLIKNLLDSPKFLGHAIKSEAW